MVYEKEIPHSDREQIAQSKQNGLVLIIEVLLKFHKLAQFLLDAITEMRFIVKARLLPEMP